MYFVFNIYPIAALVNRPLHACCPGYKSRQMNLLMTNMSIFNKGSVGCFLSRYLIVNEVNCHQYDKNLDKALTFKEPKLSGIV